jgi:hypothetical protein
MTNGEQFSEVAILNHIRFLQRFQNPLALVGHFRMAAHNVIPSLVR